MLNFSLYLNNTYYQTPESVFFHLASSDQFTSYFSFSNNQSVEIVSFNQSHSIDELQVSRSIIYRKEAPQGEYRSTIIVTVLTREEVGLSPREDTQTAILAFAVIEGNHFVTLALIWFSYTT